jgi:hypothetical protein
MKKVLLCTFSLLLGSPLMAVAGDKDWFIGPRAGISVFTGLLGAEAQYRNWALDAGYPAGGTITGGIRYYLRPYSHSWFAGAFGESDRYGGLNTIDGVTYNRFLEFEAGAAGGYRWFWGHRWIIELGLGMGYRQERWSNASDHHAENFLTVAPVIAAGVSF